MSNRLCFPSYSTDATLPFCLTYAFPGGIRGFQCAESPGLQKVYFTYSGQTDRVFSTTVLGGEEETTTTSTTSADDVTSTIGTTDNMIKTSETGSTTTTQTEAGSNEGGGGSNTGAIVGGVVGGLAVLSMLILGVLFLRRRSHNHEVAAPPPVDRGSLAMQQAEGPPPMPYSPGTTAAVSPTTMTYSKHLSQASFPLQSDMRTPVEMQADGMVGQGNTPPQWDPHVTH
ncbi:hypothetical protein EDB81DRAFT_906383 [Dactylonectria macrodidyma]|uniref:Uncharacterized protein n=1 Tax=Dactylonectria macrodidyma TaxID=307937 RepID=A0A9P9E602_9HYPO|nr:hypothetical protein EDB81DRAFT_906383 [Dactylonectria macrodidyma]